MIKNYPKGLMALVCAVSLSLSACNKQADVQPQPADVSASPQNLSEEVMSTATSAQALTATGLMLGVNGHPFGDAPYLATPATKQVELLKGMGMNWYRINVQTMSDGTISASKLFNELKLAADAGAVNLLPMLYPRTLNLADSETIAYEKGKVLGSNFAAKYGAYFTYYNLGNDLEIKMLLPNTTGRNVADYDYAKFKVTAAYLKGMDEGIKLKDADAKTMIDAGWLHWGFLNMCTTYGVKYDAVGYHWYSDMEGAAAKAPYYITDITVTLANMFPDKELWFTEYGYRYKTTSTTNETDQHTFFNKFLAKCKNNPRVKVAMAYELFDEPYKKGQEGHFGIIKWTVAYTLWLKKTIANTLTLNL